MFIRPSVPLITKMNKPKRYLNWCVVSHNHDLTESETGPWVKYSDYEALRDENEALMEDVQMMQRRLLADVTIGDGLKISAGCQISTVLASLAQDHWSKPGRKRRNR